MLQHNLLVVGPNSEFLSEKIWLPTQKEARIARAAREAEFERARAEREVEAERIRVEREAEAERAREAVELARAMRF